MPENEYPETNDSKKNEPTEDGEESKPSKIKFTAQVEVEWPSH
jgi:hypothetical protein